MLDRFDQDSCGTERLVEKVLAGRAGWLLAAWPKCSAEKYPTVPTGTKLVGLAVDQGGGSGWAAGCVDEGGGWAGQRHSPH